MNKDGSPLMQPVWYQFPNEEALYEVESQFMFGDSILVAPKITQPDEFQKSINMQLVNYYLPSSASWYNYYSKAKETVTGQWVSRLYTDLQ